ncbi:MAG: hypothetical protein U5O39_07455 [Gammaproteobacteria bacterium]|nr:hypothetical protein [Gammaproteobacteria bacterium]
MEFPEDFHYLRDIIDSAAEYSLRACDGLRQQEGDGIGHIMKAMRAQCAAPRRSSTHWPGSCRRSASTFSKSMRQGNRAPITSLQEGSNREGVGLMAAQNERNTRGGFSLYIPEHLDPDQPVSMVVALHGGTGHGADFLWSWVREARTRGFIVMAPTSQQDTRSLSGAGT